MRAPQSALGTASGPDPGVADRVSRLQNDFSEFRYAEALAQASALHADALNGGHTALAAEMALVLAKVHANQGRAGAAVEWSRQAARLADDAGDEPGYVVADGAERRAQAWVLVASECAREGGDVRGAVQAVARVQALLEQVASQRARTTVFTGLALTFGALCMPLRALESARRALDAAMALDDDTARVRCTVNLVQAGLHLFDLDDEPEAGAAQAPLLEELRRHCLWLRERWQRRPELGEATRASWVELLCRVRARAEGWAAVRPLLEEQMQRDWPAQPAMHRDLWIDLACAQRASGDEHAAAGSAGRAAAFHTRVLRPPRVDELPHLALMAELQGDVAGALELLRRHRRRTQQLMLAALQAGVDDLSSKLGAHALRHENTELRRRAEGLAASMQQAAQLAATDALTGLHNRRALHACWPLQGPGPFAVAVLDVDHFKSINDRHSHAVGDLVLRQAAQLMQRALRQPDRLGRWGGEEFVALLCGVTPAAAAAVMERVREELQSHDWHSLVPGLCVTVSIGVAGVRPELSLDEAVACADALLYQAKREGRNRVLWACT